MNYFDEDIQLMLRFQDGEESCFEQLVERHKRRVFNLAYRFLGNYQDAEDVTQEVFIKIYQAKNMYKPKAKFTTWLYTICKNTCLKKLNKKKLNIVSIDDRMELQEGMVSRQVADSHTPSPANSTLNNERVSIVKAAIDSLPVNQKMVVILYRYDRLSYEEIAKVMGCSIKAVKSLLHRAKINLKEKLSDYFKK
jgi:RNA polymerase sigma-70 factor (ECF subfamily)